MSGKGVVAEMAEELLQRTRSSIVVLHKVSRRSSGKLLSNLITLKNEVEFVHTKLLELDYSESSLAKIRCSLYDCNELVDHISALAIERQKKLQKAIVLGCGWCRGYCFSFDLKDSREVSIMFERFRYLEESDPSSYSSEVTDNLLPYPLKRCLAYCAIYPTDHRFDKIHLIHLWIALGFIHRSLNDKHQTLEDAGDEYFKILQKRNFFNYLWTDRNGNNIFKMPQASLDQARSMAGSETMILENSTTTIPDEVYHLLVDSHHLLLGNLGASSSSSSSNSLKQLISLVPVHLRSFLMVPATTMGLTTSDYDNLFSRLKHLRALDLHRSKMKVVPNSIGSLKQLRYLNLSDNDFKSLPNSITTLSKLQVLYLSDCKLLRELPRFLRRLQSLRHLYLDGCDGLIGMPVGIGRMTSLQTLSHFVVSDCQNSCKFAKLDELNSLNLRAALTFVFACNNKQQRQL